MTGTTSAPSSLEIAVSAPFHEVVVAVTAALAGQGFGVLTTIDVRGTMKAKLDVDLEDYTILGACNPPLAHQALEHDRRIGLLLPCNVIVRADPSNPHTTLVQAVDPRQMLAGGSADERMADVALDAAKRLGSALASIPGAQSV